MIWVSKVESLVMQDMSKGDIKAELQWFKEHDIRLMILDLPTSMIQVPEGQEWITEMINNILIEVLSSMAEQERLTIKKRQRQGIEAAKSKGKHLGRPYNVLLKNASSVIAQWKNCINDEKKILCS